MPRARVGHGKPAGTIWRNMRLHSWDDPARPPACGDYVWENPEEVRRGYLVVGVEETRVPTTFRLFLERLTWEDFLAGVMRGGPSWSFVRDRR